MKVLKNIFVIACLLTVVIVRGETLDSLQVLMQQGDSCMLQYNTYAALGYYQQAYEMAEKQNVVRFSMEDSNPLNPGNAPYVPEDKIPRDVRLKLADCYYQRANYRQTAELLKNMPEDSLTHEAFRQLAYSYKRQDDVGSFIYWAGQLVQHFPMDGELVAGLTLAYTQTEQPQNGIECALEYFKVDTTNIEVNRALADAYFVNRQFPDAVQMYERLLQQGDSTFNTLYSAGMCYTKTDSMERAYQCLKPAFLLSQMQHYGAAYRLGVVCIDTRRYDEGLKCLTLAVELMKPDTVTMRAITLSQGEGYYLTEHYPEAVSAWKQHLCYYPASIATYYNIANALAFFMKDDEQACNYYRQFLERARQEPKPTQQLVDMMLQAEEMVRYYDARKNKHNKHITK